MIFHKKLFSLSIQLLSISIINNLLLCPIILADSVRGDKIQKDLSESIILSQAAEVVRSPIL